MDTTCPYSVYRFALHPHIQNSRSLLVSLGFGCFDLKIALKESATVAHEDISAANIVAESRELRQLMSGRSLRSKRRRTRKFAMKLDLPRVASLDYAPKPMTTHRHIEKAEQLQARCVQQLPALVRFVSSKWQPMCGLENDYLARGLGP